MKKVMEIENALILKDLDGICGVSDRAGDLRGE